MAIDIGESSNRVVALQQALNDAASACVVADDGVFGPATKAAVADFQRQYNATRFFSALREDGVVDDDTATALGITLGNQAIRYPKGSCSTGTHPGTGKKTTPPKSDSGWGPSWDPSQGGATLPQSGGSGGSGAAGLALLLLGGGLWYSQK